MFEEADFVDIIAKQLDDDGNAEYAAVLRKISAKLRFVATSRLLAAIDSLSKDMHTSSSRPCQTCRAMTEALGKPFGCSERAK